FTVADSPFLTERLPQLYKADGTLIPVGWHPPDDAHPYRQWVITSDFGKYDRTARTLYLPDGTWWSYDGSGHPVRAGDQYGKILFDLVWSDVALQITQHVP